MEIFAELRRRFGRGEAACLALAVVNDWAVASDEGRWFRREVETRVGAQRLVGTVELFLQAIRAGLLTVEQADADKATLGARRFKMGFKSFGDLI